MRRFQHNYWTKDDTNFLNLIQECNHATLTTSSSSSEQIPRLAHFIWLGNKPLPQYAHHCIQSFITHHPHWTYRIWKDEDLATLKQEGDSFCFSFLANPHFNFGVKSDVLRYELLRRFGGVYLDVDYEFLQSLEAVVSCSTFFCGLSNTSTVEVNNGIVGCTPNHPLIIEVNRIACQRLTDYQKKEILPFLPNEVVMSFLSAAEKQRINQVIQEKLIHQTIVLTGPGLLTTVLAAFLSALSLELRSEGGVLVLPTPVLSAVPNKSMVSLSRVADPSLIGSPLPLPLPLPTTLGADIEAWRQALLSYDFFTAHEQRVSETEDDAVNWRSFEEVKRHCLERLGDNLSLATAIHWWQRSWQE